MSLLNKITGLFLDISKDIDEINKEIKNIARAMKKVFQSENGKIFIVSIGLLPMMIQESLWDIKNNLDIDIEKIVVLSALNSIKESNDRWNELIESRSVGVIELVEQKLKKNDVVIFLSSSAMNKYILGSASYAKSVGCNLSLVTNNKNSICEVEFDNKIVFPIDNYYVNNVRSFEGSTSLKMIFDSIIIELANLLGKIYKECSIFSHWYNSSNKKNIIIMMKKLTNLDEKSITKLLDETNWRQDILLLSIEKKISFEEADKLINKYNRNFIKALNHKQ